MGKFMLAMVGMGLTSAAVAQPSMVAPDERSMTVERQGAIMRAAFAFCSTTSPQDAGYQTRLREIARTRQEAILLTEACLLYWRSRVAALEEVRDRR